MDSTHKVIRELIGNAELHRFINGGGIPYSAIYQNGEEMFSCEYEDEAQMIHEWENFQRKRDIPEGYKVNPDMYETKSRRVQLIMQPSLFKKVKNTAKEMGLSLNEYCHVVFMNATK